jgi:hypothetical protein
LKVVKSCSKRGFFGRENKTLVGVKLKFGGGTCDLNIGQYNLELTNSIGNLRSRRRGRRIPTLLSFLQHKTYCLISSS